MSLKSVQNSDEVLRKGPWMPEEDEILVEYVRQFGARDWSSIRTKGLLPRTGKSCRLRWVNKLKPDLKRSGCKFSPEEEKLVVEMQAKLGNKWAKIASCLPGRTDNDVKNFWSTRQKRILRALQRPKMPSGSTDASADTSDLSKDPTMADFGGFQVHSPSGAASLMGSGMGPHFIFAEGDSEFRDHASDSSLRSHLHPHHHHHHHHHHPHRHPNSGLHHHHSFHHAMDDDADDVLTSHHTKLSDPLAANAAAAAGEMVAYAGEKELTSSMEMKETKPSTTYLHQPLSVALPCVTMASRNSSSTTTTTTTTQRSIKRRPRSRRDTRSTILSCFEQPVAMKNKADPCCCINNLNNNNHSNDGAIPDNNNPNNICNPNSRPSHPTSFTLTDSQQNSSSSNNNNNNTTTTTATTNTTNTTNTTTNTTNTTTNTTNTTNTTTNTTNTTTNTTNNNNPNNSNNNYLEFLLQSDGSLMQSVQIFSPEFPLFLTNNHQWEKLPMLYSEDASLYGGCNTKDNTDSCSPDSVITNFTADVFDSLEPLNSTPSEWWVAQ